MPGCPRPNDFYIETLEGAPVLPEGLRRSGPLSGQRVTPL